MSVVKQPKITTTLTQDKGKYHEKLIKTQRTNKLPLSAGKGGRLVERVGPLFKTDL